jgi:RHS repeat-associated protein
MDATAPAMSPRWFLLLRVLTSLFACFVLPHSLARGSSLPGILAANYAYDANDRVSGATYDANDRVSGATYDANGNTVTATLPHPVTGQPGQVFDQYDHADRLKDRNSGQIRLVYDGDGNRVAKTVNGVTMFYLVDDLNPSGYAQVVEELQASALSPLPSITRVYTYDYALNSQQQWLPDGQGGFGWTASFYGYDDHGSVRYLTDAAGHVTDTYDYDAFGNLVQQGGGTPNLYLYAGEQFDPDLQLYYLRARYLNPDTGRFWTRDPFEGFQDDPYSLNGYLYAHGDPVNHWDPSGFYTLAETQQAQGIGARLKFTHQVARFRKAAQTACRVVSKVGKARQAVETVQSAQQLAAGVAGAAGELTMLVLEEAFELRGLDTARLRMNDLEEVLNAAQTPCFAAGTLISTEQGLRAIETLKAGDRVWALGQGTVEVKLKPITEVFRSEVTNLVILTIGNERIETTPEHPFWVRDEGWTPAGLLKPGDQLLARGHIWLPITSVESRSGQFTVFNFEVEDFHTYLVGEQKVVVHNPKSNPNLRALPSGTIRTSLQNAEARRYYRNHRLEAIKRWEQKTGKKWPLVNGRLKWAEHPRPLKQGGCPLDIEPGVGDDPNAPHMIPGPDGLTDQQRWGALGGKKRWKR